MIIPLTDEIFNQFIEESPFFTFPPILAAILYDISQGNHLLTEGGFCCFHDLFPQKQLKKCLTFRQCVTIMIGSANADKSLLPARPGA